MEFKLGFLNFNNLSGYKKKKKKLRFYDLHLKKNIKEKYVPICNCRHLLIIKRKKSENNINT